MISVQNSTINEGIMTTTTTTTPTNGQRTNSSISRLDNMEGSGSSSSSIPATANIQQQQQQQQQQLYQIDNNTNLNDIVYSLKRMVIERNINSFAISTFLTMVVMVGLINLTSHSLLWMCAMLAILVTLFQIWYALRENRLLFAPTINGGGYLYPGQHTIWGVNRYNTISNNNNGGNQPYPHHRFPHLINAPLNLQLTLIDRDFNSNDYEMLLALDSDNQNYGGANREQIDLLPLHTIQSEKDMEALFHTKDSTLTSCSICLEQFNVTNILRTLPCVHYFHSECVDKWLKIKSNCPICKAEVF